jgi:hypothetical protein
MKTRHYLILLVAVVLSSLSALIASEAFAAPIPNTIGVGAMFGEPTGLSGEYVLAPDRAIDGALAYSFARSGDMQIHSDYLIFTNAFFPNQAPQLLGFFGGGMRLKFEDSARFGFRVPVGVNYQPEGSEIHFFGEFAPILDFAPDWSLSFNLSVGFRFFFSVR